VSPVSPYQAGAAESAPNDQPVVNIVEDTRSYERWLAGQIPLVQADLRLKHERICRSAQVGRVCDPHGTFFRTLGP
jgi:hypothetical protein